MKRSNSDQFVHRGEVDLTEVPEGDPGSLPEECLEVPGFIGEVMDATLRSAPYPNRTLAFAGALALQSFLAGRTVRDCGDTRPNLYLLALAHSGAGKDAPRKMNAAVLREVGLQDNLAHHLASGEGLQDALKETPALLAQTDEFDTVLQSFKRDRDGRYESLIGAMLTLYSSSNSVFSMRRRAGGGLPGSIDRPCFVLFGTAIPNHYYDALSERMLTNGLFARTMVLEAGSRGKGQRPRLIEPSESVLETARFWADRGGFDGSSFSSAPKTTTLALDSDAVLAYAMFTKQVERCYEESERGDDAVGTTVWARAVENARKLALLYSISADREAIAVSGEAAEWSIRIVEHQVRRMLFMASMRASGSEFEQLAQSLLHRIRGATDGIAHSDLLRRSKMRSVLFREVMDTLIERDDVVKEEIKTSGRTGVIYRIPGKEGEGSGKEVGA